MAKSVKLFGGLFNWRRPPASPLSQLLASFTVHFSKQRHQVNNEGSRRKEVERSSIVFTSHKGRKIGKDSGRDNGKLAKKEVRHCIQDWWDKAKKKLTYERWIVKERS